MKKIAIVIGIVGIIGIGQMLPVNAVGVDVINEAPDTTNIESLDNDETIADSEPDDTDEIITDTEEIPEDEVQNDSVNIPMSGTISYYLNMKRYEELSGFYQEMDELLIKKTEIYKKLAESGETTYISVKQIETQEQQAACQVDICCNELDYNRYIISKSGISFDDVDISSIKNVDDIKSYTVGKSDYDASAIARYVTDCKNAVANINAKEVEVETLNATNEQVKVLKKAGEMSELDVIDSKLAVLKAQIELENYYYEMNVNYYLLNE